VRSLRTQHAISLLTALAICLICAGYAPVNHVPVLSIESRPVKTRDFDLDTDGTTEHYLLQDGRIGVAVGSRKIWRSPGEWWVDDFILGDVTGDAVPDLIISVWKAGSFGRDKPFWVGGEDSRVKNHLFIFDLVGGSFKPVWQSSDLDRPNHGLSLEDVEGDGLNELIALEGDYDDSTVQQTTVWRWNGWGFSMVSLSTRTPPGISVQARQPSELPSGHIRFLDEAQDLCVEVEGLGLVRFAR